MPLGFNTATDPNFAQGVVGSGGAKINRTTLATVVTEAAAAAAPNATPVISDVGGSAAAGDPIYGAHLDTPAADTVLSGANVAGGSAEAAYALLELKQNVDTMSVTAGALFNQVSNVMSHLGSLNAGYALDVASKMDVDFAGETTELAKGQILAQAGTAMLAQANAQGQGMLALIQS